MADARIVFSAQDRTRAAFDSVRGNLQGMTEKAQLAAGTLAGLSGAVTLGAMTALARTVVNGLDAFNDLADATGASVEKISGLDNIARRTGTSFDTVASSLVKFNGVLTATRKEGGEAAEIFKAMGLNAKQLREIDPAEAMRQTAVALSQFADDGDKARAVQELFGKSIRDVAPLLKDLAEAGELQATVTRQQAEEAERLNKQIYALSAGTNDLGRSVVSGALPTLNSLVTTFTDLKISGGSVADVMGGAMRVAFETVGVLGREAIYMFGAVQKELGGIAAQMVALATGDFKGFSAIGEAMREDAARARQENDAAIYRLLNAGELSRLYGVDSGDALSRRLGRTGAKTLTYRSAAEGAQKQERQHLALMDAHVKEFQKEQDRIWEQAAKLAELRARNSQEYLQSLDKEMQSVEEAARAAEWQASIYGLSADQVARLTRARIEDERQQGLAVATTAKEIDAVERIYKARMRLVDTDMLEANREAARAAASEWAQVGQSLTDALMTGGKNVAQYLKDLFRTLVLRPIISPIGTAMATALGGFPTAANASGSGILGSLGSSFAASSFGSSIGSVSGIANGLSAWGSGGSVMGMFSNAGLYTGMELLGAALPIVGVIAAVAALASKFKGETRSGGQYNFGSLISGPSGGEIGVGSASAGAAAAATANSINALLSSIGSTSRLSNFMTGLETSDRGKGFAYAGGTLTTGGAFGQGWGAAFSQDGWNNRRGNFTADEAVAAFSEELKQATLQALQAATDVPLAIAELVKGKDFDSMGAEQLDAVLNQVNAAITTVDQFRAAVVALPFQNLRDLSFDAATAMGKAVGGLERLSAGASDFFAGYYSEEEQRRQAALNIRNVLAGAGADFSVDQILGSNRTQFRQLTEYYATRTDEPGQKLYATLLAVSGAFAAIHPQVTTLAEAINTGADSMQAYSDSLRDQAELLGNNIDTMQDFASSLRRFRGELTMGALAQLSPEARYNAARGEFQRLAALSPTDPARLGGLEEAGRAFLEASQAYNASSMAYFVDLAAVRGAVEASESAALSNAQISQMQLNVLNQQLSALQGIQANTAPGATAPAPAGGSAWGGSTTSSTGAAWGGSGTAIASTSWANLLASIDWSDGAAGTAQLAGYMRSYGKNIGDVQSVYNWYTTQQLADHMKQYGYADMVPGYASGGTAQGYAWVGERGRELAFFPQPTRIYSAAESQQMAAGGGGSDSVLAELRRVREALSAELQTLRLVVASYAQRDLDNGATVAAGLEETRRALRDKPPEVRRALRV